MILPTAPEVCFYLAEQEGVVNSKILASKILALTNGGASPVSRKINMSPFYLLDIIFIFLKKHGFRLYPFFVVAITVHIDD